MFVKYLRLLYRFGRMFYYSVLCWNNLVTPRVLCAGKPYKSRKNTIHFLGKDVYIGYNCHFGADVTFGNQIMLASNVSFVGGDHRWDVIGTPIKDTGRDTLKTIEIGDDVWIGHGAIILHGVVLGEGCIVAAGSVVVKSVAPYTIVGGNPAREIKKRFTEVQIVKHKLGLAKKSLDRQ